MSELKSDVCYLTVEGFEALKAELQNLLQKERPRLVETIAWAASNGDRSENADYIYGKRRLREIDRRIHYLMSRLDRAKVIDVSQIRVDRVVFGAWVKLESDSGQVVCYQLVGEDEIDVSQGRISWKSPLGQSLLGKQVGDVFEVQTPKGIQSYEILAIARSRGEVERFCPND